MAKIVVGDDKIPFYIHRSFLTHYSAFFKELFVRLHEEATPSITLENISSATFELLAHWIYSQGFSGKEFDSADMAKLWTVGGKLEMPCLQNAVMEVLLKIMQTVPNEPRDSFLRYVFENSANTKLRKLTVHALAAAPPEMMKHVAEFCPRDVLIDILLQVQHIDNNNTPVAWRPKILGIETYLIRVDGVERNGAEGNIDLKKRKEQVEEGHPGCCSVMICIILLHGSAGDIAGIEKTLGCKIVKLFHVSTFSASLLTLIESNVSQSKTMELA